MIRYGKVTSIFPERGTVKVTFEDLKIPSSEIPVLVGRTEGTRHYSLPKVGEVGICIFPENSFYGFYLGSGYDRATKIPEGAGENIEITVFRDGTTIKYDENKSELYIDCKGTIKIVAKEIDITAPKIEITGDINLNGTLNATTEVTANGISLTKHIHEKVTAGNDKTGGPQ